VTPLALLLVLLSVGLHVAWNLVSKRERPTSAFFLVCIATSAALLAPVQLWFHDVWLPALGLVWPLLVASGLFSTVYNVALAGAYRAADLSLVYPLSRSVAPVLVALASFGLGRGDRIGWGCWTGIALILLGSGLLPLRSWRDLRLERYLGGGFALAVITACATAGYTLVDDLGVRRAAGSGSLGSLEAGLLYGALHACANSACLAVWVGASAQGRRDLRAVLRGSMGRAALVGVVSYAAYILVLAAMTLVRDVSYVSAFRQLGVPLSVAAGAWLLRERLGGPKLAGAAVVFAGLVLVALR
jgi:drug/metabolite transporter (DMT)-like permease